MLLLLLPHYRYVDVHLEASYWRTSVVSKTCDPEWRGDTAQTTPFTSFDSLLHLVLAPDTGDAKSLAQRSREGQAWVQQACGQTATDSLVARDNARAFGKKNQKKKGKKVNNKSSLYERCGGVFGVAAFVDRCMDAWMADPILNANDAVATWHERAQRCGFKFLVTQLMGYLCGGPQIVSCPKGVWLRVCIGYVNWCVD